MNLLPKSSKEFGSVDYWEKFFQQRGKKAFEWYGTYLELCDVLHKYVKPREKVLVIGCGNSELSEQLYDLGYQDIVNIDISEVVIKQMKERNASRRPHMSFLKMDMTQMEFPDATFQVVLDKGTLDAVLTDEEEKTLQQVDRMLAEVGRVLQVGGRYLCISLAQAHILKKAVGHFSREGWMVRVHQVATSQDQAFEAEPRFPLPVFAFVMTKFRPVPGSALQIFELCTQEQGKPVRLESADRLAEAVRERQHYAWLCSQLRLCKAGLGSVSLDLCSGDTGEPRYTLHVVDNPTVKPSRDRHFAIFIIPQGRETEWLFGMEEGRKQLAASAGFRRLVTVALHRGQRYDGMESIQTELSTRVMELAPAGMPPQQQVPFLSVGGDIGVRTVQHQDHSALSGDYVIEDVQGEDRRYFRRLIFLSNRNVVQSEARLLKDVSHRAQKKQKKDKKKHRPADTSEDFPPGPGQPIDKSYLCCEHHKAMVAGLALLRNPELLLETPLALLVVGLGGGSLPVFIHDHFPKSHIDAVEIDPSMLHVATQWFGFSQSDRMKVHIADGLDYIASLAGGEARPHYDVIMFDVDSKDPTLGMSCPPPAFVDQLFLQKVKSILSHEGIFILNLVCRDLGLKDSVLAGLREAFPLLYVRRIEGEVNEILFCQLHPEQKLATAQLLEMAQALERTLRKPGRAWDDTYVLSDMLKTVKIV